MSSPVFVRRVHSDKPDKANAVHNVYQTCLLLKRCDANICSNVFIGKDVQVRVIFLREH